MFLQLKIFFSILLVANFVNSCNGAVVQPTNQLSRIAWGKNSSIEKHPHLVGVEQKGWVCAGSLISSTCVLTAAHCLHNETVQKDIPAENFTIRGGTTFYGEGGYVQYVEKYRRPENYNEIPHDMDVAVIKLKQPMKGKNIKPIEIDFGDESISEDDLLTVAGWGDAERTSIERNQLKETYVHVSRWMCKIIQYNDNVLCTWNGRHQPCSGDSGGALLHNGKQVGIVSFGFTFGHCGKFPLPSVFTNLKSHEVKEFFVDATQELNCWD